jgi:hypothetical protein
MINVAYDDINKLNLSNYNIIPEWALKDKTDLIKLLGNDYNNFYKNTLTYFLNYQIKSIYPIILFDNSLFEKYVTIELPEELLYSIKLKLTKIVFVYILEGYFGDESHYQWLIELCVKYNLKKEDVLVITANFNTKENDFFEIFRYNFFENHVTFPIELSYKNILGYDFKKHFLCFNGIPRLNRLMMFSELNSNEKLINKSICSLRNIDNNDKEYFYRISGIEFYKNYDSTKNHCYDLDDWLKNNIGGSAILNKSAHSNTFLNVVTETLFDENVIFLTEKTFKPIYMCQPFIIFGNPNSIKKLKEFGYKTFDLWWDESYDEELDLNKRFKKIISILEKIADLSLSECVDMKKQMEHILIHNHKHFMRKHKSKELYDLLETTKGNVSKSLI